MNAAVQNKTGEPHEVATIRNLPDPGQAPVRMLHSPVHSAA